MARKQIQPEFGRAKPKSKPRRRTARRKPENADRRQYESDVLDEAKQRRARRTRAKRIKGLKVL